MKPLWRWVVGDVHKDGLSILRQSIKNVKSLYGSLFDYLVCFNGIEPSRLPKGIEIYTQSTDLSLGNINGPTWKLCPPRIRENSHEIIVDNDILFYSRIPEIDIFLEGELGLMGEGMIRQFGIFDNNVKKGIKLNSGIVGYPPGFVFDTPNIEWQTHFDEQGFVASILQNRCIVISIQCLSICLNGQETYGSHATHFCGANYGKHISYRRILSEISI